MNKPLASMLARATLCGALLFSATAGRAGIPVIDVAGLMQAVMEVMQSMQQIANQVQQIRQMEAQLESMTGARSLGDVMNNPALQNYLPHDAAQTLNSVRMAGYSGLSGSARILRDEGMTYNCMDRSGAARTSCQAQLALPYQNKAFMQDAIEASRGRMGQIQALMQRLGSTTDQKEATEIVGRIEAENAMLQHQQTQINLARGVAEADLRIAESKAREAQLQQASRTGRLSDYAPR